MNVAQIKASDKHAFAVLSNFQMSYRKVNLVMDAIRGIKAAEALACLEFMRNKSALPIHKLLRSAIDNASQKQLSGTLFVEHAFASRSKVLKRLDIKGRGRSGVKEKPYCHATVILAVKADKKASKDASQAKGNRGTNGSKS